MRFKNVTEKISTLFILGIIFLLFALIGCGGGGSSDGGGGDSGQQAFWAVKGGDYTTDSSQWYQLNATLAKTGTRCLIYVENSMSVSSSTIDNIASEFDTKMWDVVNNNFASPTDVDGNGKIIILLMDIQDGYNPPAVTSYTGGYFFPIDLLTNNDLISMGYPSFYKSNEAEILYIDIYPSDPTTADGKSTIVHEFQHLVNFSRNVIAESGNEQPVWINEGFSTSAEAIYQEVDILSSRESWYENDPLLTGAGGVTIDTGKSISYGYPLIIWDAYPTNPYAVLNNYTMSHLFFSWLRIHMGSDSFFKDINNSTNNTVQSVINVCSAIIGSDVDSWQKMLGKWYMANLLGGDGKTSGLESYNDLNTHTGPYSFDSPSVAVSLYPSGALHFNGTSYNNWSPVGGHVNISYAMGHSSGSSDYVAGFGDGTANNKLIVFNVEGSGTTSRASAVLPSISFNLQMLTLSEGNDQKFKSIDNISELKLPEGALRKGLEPAGQDLEELSIK